MFSFAVGAAEGNLQEVGVGWDATGSALFSRALILDGGGSPTSITVLSDEILKVTYQFRRYICEVDTTGSVTLNSISYDYTGRAANCGDTTFYWPAIFNALNSPPASFTYCHTYNGAIGAITSAPTGVSGTYTSTVDISEYVSGTYTTTWEYSFSLSQGNATTGIMSISLYFCGAYYQIGFDPVIPKTSDETLILTFQASWARLT